MLSTEALEGDAKLFLATHVPVADFHVGGSLASDVVPNGERGLLHALAKLGMRHAFCVVEGEPGSGKSHLIRWLKVKWPAQEDLVLLIQRLDGSLQGTLRQLEQARLSPITERSVGPVDRFMPMGPDPDQLHAP